MSVMTGAALDSVADPGSEDDAGRGSLVAGDLVRAVEGLLAVLDRPLRPAEVAAAWDVPEAAVSSALQALAERLERDGHGVTVRATGGGWRLFAAPDLTRAIEAVVVREVASKLSAAALETLAIVAYQQPVSRSRVAAIRGVSVDAVMRTLTARGLVTDVGVDPATGATLYGTTDVFLELLGLTSCAELPRSGPAAAGC